LLRKEPVPHEVVLWHFKWKASLFHIDVQRRGVPVIAEAVVRGQCCVVYMIHANLVEGPSPRQAGQQA
jgi:hypothetical protein